MRAHCVLVCLAALAACARPPSPPPPAPAGATQEAQLESGFITLRLVVPPAPAGPKPALVSFLGEDEALLAAGLVVVVPHIHWELLRGLAPPAPPAENTVGVWLLASPTPRTIGRQYFRLVAANADLLPRIIDYLVTLPDVDPARIAVAGTSTNGFVTLEATAAEPRLAAAAVIAACGDYHCFLQRSRLALQGAPLDLEPDYEAWLRGREPVRHPERVTHAALLMVNGSDDVAVPLPCARETAGVLRAAFRRAGRPERFRFVPVEGAGHTDLASRAREEALAWFRRWLFTPPPSSAVESRGH